MDEVKNESSVYPKSGGPYSLYCEQCHCWVPNTANNEMRKEGYFSHSHVCGDLSNREIVDNENVTNPYDNNNMEISISIGKTDYENRLENHNENF